MFKLFKRQKSRRERTRADGCEKVSTLTAVAATSTANAPSTKRDSLRSTSSFCDELLMSEDAISCGGGSVISGLTDIMGADEEIFKYHSRLSMSMQTIVNDLNCLSYFVQYLETKNSLPLIKFYLDTDNFKTVALAQLEKEQQTHESSQVDVVYEEDEQQQQQQQHEQRIEAEHNTKVAECSSNNANATTTMDEEVNETDNVPELKTLCDLSMRKPLTDDEKSQIYAQTTKQITKCSAGNSNHVNNISCNNKLNSNSELSLCSVSTSTTTEEPDYSTGKISAASIKDAIAIYQKYLIADAKHFVQLPVKIISEISLLLCKRHDDIAGTADDTIFALPICANCFDDAQQYVLDELERDYLNDFLQSTYYCKYCIELIENGQQPDEYNKLNIYDILHSDVTLFFFMEFLEQSGERDCFDFWTAAINFRKSFTNASGRQLMIASETEAQSDAMIIYEKFFSLQSENRLWLSDKLRSHVEERICGDSLQVAYCFDVPLQIVAKYLERKYLDDFLKSQLFQNYLNELKTKVKEEHNFTEQQQHVSSSMSAKNILNMQSAPTPTNKLSLRRRYRDDCSSGAMRHRKTRSDCSNESTGELFKHISQHNTLLAMDTSSSLHLRNLHAAGTNYNIDARQLTDPNLLWQRPKATSTDAGAGSSSTSSSGGLKFGRINALGRYERDFEAVDAVSNAGKHSWTALSGNKIKNVMRKLVNLPEDKVQEEIAWQVAEMIVKDVTSVTLKNGYGNMNANEQRQ